ncbi:hypothetical protein Y032_0042g552 [Ancylostoma ceylanicum]|uniref:Uncharacterized protein n=1 Tax=Ancylostoma ceylanicum TaxID=53326 RepID=A0A016UG32_9BILA|nr:hypothetical protein Y032_0042g552 [Ancylostoma ceylanicum]
MFRLSTITEKTRPDEKLSPLPSLINISIGTYVLALSYQLIDCLWRRSDCNNSDERKCILIRKLVEELLAIRKTTESVRECKQRNLIQETPTIHTRATPRSAAALAREPHRPRRIRMGRNRLVRALDVLIQGTSTTRTITVFT